MITGFTIHFSGRSLQGELVLPSSKSISNRVLIIRALTVPAFSIENISPAEDTRLLEQILREKKHHVFTGDGGTTFRFLLAYLCTLNQSFVLGGSAQFNRRPIAPLVDALIQLGAKIEYLENEGFAPVRICASKLHGVDVRIDASVSSQFVSALMLIGPVLPQGLRIHLSSEVVSEPYIRMTADVMKEFGINLLCKPSIIEIPPQAYRSNPYVVASDWSSAAFWYQWVSVLPVGSRILLKSLKITGLQGDEQAEALYRMLGVFSKEKKDGTEIYKPADIPNLDFSEPIDLKNCPDLAPAFICSLSARSIRAKISGLQTLAVKESDRIKALQLELGKLGVVTSAGIDWLSLNSYYWNFDTIPLFDSHQDHRIAMAMAPFSVMFSKIRVINPWVVNKSYPEYWNHLQDLGLIKINNS